MMDRKEHWVSAMLGLHWGDIGKMEYEMETTILGFWFSGLGVFRS